MDTPLIVREVMTTMERVVLLVLDGQTTIDEGVDRALMLREFDRIFDETYVGPEIAIGAGPEHEEANRRLYTAVRHEAMLIAFNRIVDASEDVWPAMSLQELPHRGTYPAYVMDETRSMTAEWCLAFVEYLPMRLLLGYDVEDAFEFVMERYATDNDDCSAYMRANVTTLYDLERRFLHPVAVRAEQIIRAEWAKIATSRWDIHEVLAHSTTTWVELFADISMEPNCPRDRMQNFIDRVGKLISARSLRTWKWYNRKHNNFNIYGTFTRLANIVHGPTQTAAYTITHLYTSQLADFHIAVRIAPTDVLRACTYSPDIRRELATRSEFTLFAFATRYAQLLAPRIHEHNTRRKRRKLDPFHAKPGLAQLPDDILHHIADMIQPDPHWIKTERVRKRNDDALIRAMHEDARNALS
jgi:hypothetical protein